MDLRVGQGLDVHQFSEGRRLVLGGIEIPFERGLLGHSDADALLHAITDAVLGALGWGDIGVWFPDTSNDYKDADSRLLLKDVWTKATAEGWTLVNADTTVLCQRPKLRPYMDPMREEIAKLFQVDVSRIGIKATTTEKLGFVGREEGILASAVVLLSRN